MSEQTVSTPASKPPGSPVPPTSATDASGSQELAAAVDDLLDQLQHKFDNVSSEIFGKLDDMARRLDELEASLTVASDTTTAK
ncbi:hypothetical protein DTO166G4_8825 [Paecilomyces variotii]|uniref:Heat shock factor binding protein 1-domain-containing protein n=1 Tax=Byssochlamys spectabilis TaxID=264951 RepID=A0A443HPQ9_BYSSP|nr:heat shock factor binding protein 1-domain-containing protein [Paecilomyces variotii]KAJ9204057.1 hypothetical protein DTO032I3_2863 [Paecilomyces variotii]KAJ9205996.1 hypothetical protein DTO164E3_1249 [Paecilomyces variotii]KAJ9209575.1 hypothetical protein DTO166G4_8825 [Paecilomyces variotii]KAJ9226882.1 hypothetical protein DTO169C6_637 [Paecilomyces variotii]KAJ9234371.1 hypothetical protein DTO166G5_5177 [Paecilomyces variotii]